MCGWGLRAKKQWGITTDWTGAAGAKFVCFASVPFGGPVNRNVMRTSEYARWSREPHERKMMRDNSVTYIALLRGVNNVGSASRVAMADLRALFQALGFLNVRTLLNSGNVVFSVPTKGRRDLRDSIEKALASRLGLTSRVIILSADEVRAVVRDNPLSHVATNPSHLLVLVPQDRSDLGRLKPLVKKGWSPEELALGNRVAYVWCAKGVAKSPLWAAVDRALEGRCTARNIATVTKAAALVEWPQL